MDVSPKLIYAKKINNNKNKHNTYKMWRQIILKALFCASLQKNHYTFFGSND